MTREPSGARFIVAAGGDADVVLAKHRRENRMTPLLRFSDTNTRSSCPARRGRSVREPQGDVRRRPGPGHPMVADACTARSTHDDPPITAPPLPAAANAHIYPEGLRRRSSTVRREVKRKVDRGGVICWRCGQSIHPAEPWDLGHSDHRLAKHLGSCMPGLSIGVAAARREGGSGSERRRHHHGHSRLRRRCDSSTRQRGAPMTDNPEALSPCVTILFFSGGFAYQHLSRLFYLLRFPRPQTIREVMSQAAAPAQGFVPAAKPMAGKPCCQGWQHRAKIDPCIRLRR